MTTMASQITSHTIVYSNVYSDADQRKHQSSAPLAFVRGIHRGPVNSPHKWLVTRKMVPFDDVIMTWTCLKLSRRNKYEKYIFVASAMYIDFTKHKYDHFAWLRSFLNNEAGKNGRHFAGDIFEFIFLNEHCISLNHNLLRFVQMAILSRITSLKN